MQYRFEDYVLDPERRELTRGVETVAVGPKIFDLLLYLVQHRDRVVSKDDLLQAVWDGRIVSESTLTSHINGLRKAIGDNGETQRLIRTASRKGFRFVGDVREETRAPDGGAPLETGTAGSNKTITPVLALPDKPSIAVLAFQNLSGDPQQEYFADGVVEDIITALSRIGWLFVIARNSSFTYKGRAVDVKQVGRELGVRYVLEGSMRKAANRVRITGQLIDATTGAHIWADRFESALDDIFEVQDRMAEGVVGVIAPQVERAEIERAMRKPTGSLDAYDCYLRALPHFHALTREGVDQALALLDRAVAIDPHFALAKALAARCYAWRNPHGWAAAPEAEKATAARLGQEALRDGADDPTVLWMVGFALWQLRIDPERALALYDRSLALNANGAQALGLRGWALATAGQPNEALPPLLKAIRLSPYDPEAFFTMTAIGCTHLLAERFDEAVTWTSRALRERPFFAPALRFHAACLIGLGRVQEARDTIAHLLQQEPTLTVSALRRRAPIFDAKLMDAYLDGLRKAGLPE